MQKPTDYETAQIMGEFTRLKPGGHYLIIRSVEEVTSKGGNAMLKICFDTDKTDSQPKFFATEFETRANNPERTWPNGGTSYIITDDQYGTSRLKGFVTSVEASNPGFKVAWGDGPAFGKQFWGRRVGGVFAEELDWYEAKAKVTHKTVLLRWTSVNKVGEVVVPDVRESKNYKAAKERGVIGKPAPTVEDVLEKISDWQSIPDFIEEDLPFN